MLAFIQLIKELKLKFTNMGNMPCMERQKSLNANGIYFWFIRINNYNGVLLTNIHKQIKWKMRNAPDEGTFCWDSLTHTLHHHIQSGESKREKPKRTPRIEFVYRNPMNHFNNIYSIDRCHYRCCLNVWNTFIYWVWQWEITTMMTTATTTTIK